MIEARYLITAFFVGVSATGILWLATGERSEVNTLGIIANVGCLAVNGTIMLSGLLGQ